MKTMLFMLDVIFEITAYECLDYQKNIKNYK